jgi:hypothetical protein
MSQERVKVSVHCAFAQYTWPLYEIVFNANWKFSSYALDKKKAMEK